MQRGTSKRRSIDSRDPSQRAPRKRRSTRIAATALAAATLLIGCGDDATPAAGGAAGATSGGSAGATDGTGDAGADPAALSERGRVVYATNCIACHARDPREEGGLGPAIAGSSSELIAARVLHAEYPPGYTPKADTKLMIALPHLERDIDALAAFLASPD